MVVEVSGDRKIQSSGSRQSSSGRVQQYIHCGSTVILLCPSSNGKVFGVRIDAEDLGRVLEAGPWSVSNFDRAKGRVRLYCHSTRRTPGYLHRFILNAPKGLEVDHSHNRSLDNSRSEIRLATKSLNQRNKGQAGPPNRFGMRGVTPTRSGRYSARVWVDNKSKIIGTYDTPAEAAERVREFLVSQGAEYAAGRTA